MDYRELLKKYIEHVGDCEGVIYLGDSQKNLELFTQDEWDELQELGYEVTVKCNPGFEFPSS